MADQFFWYQLMTSDPKAALDFYTQVVGWSPREVSPQYTVLEAGGHGIGGIAQLGEDMVRAGGRLVWLAYIHVADVKAAVEAVRAAGGKVYHEPEDIGVGVIALVTDLQGAPFMLMTPRPPEGAPKGGPGAPGFAPTQQGHGAWHELHTTDWQAAFDFYSKQFGWREDGRHEMGAMGTYLLFAADSGQIGGMFNSPGAQPQPFWLVYFNVDSVDAAVDRVKAAGGQIANGPHDVPGGARVVQAIDPQGAMFALTSAGR